MSGMIFFGWDSTRPEGDRGLNELVNGTYWDAFGDLLDEVLLADYPDIHQIIKSEEGYAAHYYFFDDLDKVDFNLVIKLIRQHLLNMTAESWNWQHRDYVQELLAWKERGFLAWLEPSDWEHKGRMSIEDISEWQQKACRVWDEIAEPFVVLDDRYDAKLAE